MNYIDTQILSYIFKGNTGFYTKSIKGEMISSIVACEFLNVFKKNDLKNARYYPFYSDIFLNNVNEIVKAFDSKKHCKRGKLRTDRVLIELHNKYESFIIYGNESLAKLINSRTKKGIMVATEHLSKLERKDISNKIDFLLDNDLKVTPLNEKIVINMLEIMASIEGGYNLKNDFRNSMMDLLIASTALTDGVTLRTTDKELNRLLCRVYDLPYTISKGILTISDESIQPNTKEWVKDESKNYINRGWQYKINKVGK